MSVALMTLAFKAPVNSTQKLVLLALCDCANDQGECYPSVSTLSEKCSLSDRAIQDAIASLEALGQLRREFRSGRATVYWMTPNDELSTTPERGSPRSKCTPKQIHPTPERGSPPPPNVVHPTPERGSPRTIKEPSIETSRNRSAAALSCPDDVDGQVWGDWLALRKAKRAPVTRTTVDGARVEAKKAGMSLEAFLRIWCQRGSQGLSADWLKPAEKAQSQSEDAERTKRMLEERTLTDEQRARSDEARRRVMAAVRVA